MPELINICEQAARLGGAELLRWKGKFSVTEKSVADLVTEADFASQRAIYDLLTREFPDHGFHGEEELSVMENTKADLHSDHCWVVDPLDGTTNYVHGLPYYCVSVAMVAHGKTQVAAVYDPERDECFSAIAGENSKCNGQLIFTSDAEKVSESLLVTGFGPNAAGKTHEMDWFMRASTQAQSLRRMGAAALNLAYVACGRMDGYWQTTAKAWDVAAGDLLVRQAGGHVTSIDGSQFDLRNPKMVASATPGLSRAIVQMLDA